jgi:catechol 2,3-dioxygenase-like lactoylglutathione lyase family enzyme
VIRSLSKHPQRGKENEMGLQDSTVGAAIAVDDMGKAKEFYEGKLGFSGGEEVDDGGVTYQCGDGTRIHVFPSPGNAGKSEATQAGFEVDDLESVVDELSSNGVEFEQYDSDPIKTDEKGIAQLGSAKVAWMKDPDGNVLALTDGG